MTKTLQEALAPLLIIGSFYNLFEYPFRQPKPYLSYLHILVTLSLFTYLFYYPTYYVRWENTASIWLDIIQLISLITSILVNLFRYKELKMCLHELSIIDDTLEALGAPKKYHQLRNRIIRIIIGWIIWIFAYIVTTFYMVPFNYMSFYDLNFFDISLTFVKVYILLYQKIVYILSALIWGTILGYISSRFLQVNDLLHVLYTDFCKNNADYRRQNRFILVRQQITGTKDCKQYLWILMHIHLQLCLTSRKLNKVLNIQLLLHMQWYFLQTIAFCITMCWLFINRVDMWADHYYLLFLYREPIFVLYTAAFLKLNYICQTIYCKINETITILYKLSIYNFDKDLREQILKFILQIKLRETKFGMGLLCFGYTFICELYSTVFSVLMILIQMDLAFTD